MTKNLKGYSTDKIEIIKCKNHIFYKYIIDNKIYEEVLENNKTVVEN